MGFKTIFRGLVPPWALVNTFPARPAGAVSGEGIAVGAVQARAVVAAVVAPPSRGTCCKDKKIIVISMI